MISVESSPGVSKPRLVGSKSIVVPDLAPRWGGPSVSVPTLCAELHARDPSVAMYFAADQLEASWPAYYQGYSKSFPRGIHASQALRRALLAGQHAIVHHHALWLPSLGYAFEAARRSHCPLIISPRGMLSPYALARARFKKWLARRWLHPGAFEGAAAWHATSDLEFTEIRGAGFSQPVLVSANGVSIPDWHEPVDRARWLARHPELAGKRLLLFYSRLHSKKGVLPLLDTWGRIASQHPDWHLLIAGSPHEYDQAQIQQHVRRLRLEERSSVADPTGLPKPYRLAELYILPTHSENFGLTIAESLASGVAALTTTGAPWQEMNARGCGSCVPLDRIFAQLEALLRVDAAELRTMGEVGRDWMAADFSWPRKAAEMLDFYASLCPA